MAPRCASGPKDAFKDFGGSKVLFGKLQDEEGQEELLGKLRSKAVQQLPKQNQGIDPLLSALAALTPDEQREKFRQLLQRAMQQAPLNLTGGFGIVRTATPAWWACRMPTNSSAPTAPCSPSACRRAPA
nr:hypothetical protein [Pseudomonas sp. BIGb0427]